MSTTPIDDVITRAVIHPAIGIARVGDSEDEFLIGPEVVDAPPLPAGSYKDATGALKRQAARFRLYGYNAAGEVVAELTPDNAEIEWTVHIANTKAAWYEFQLALDIPDASDPTLPPSKLRNGAVPKNQRDKLRIDPGPRSISGVSTSGSEYAFDSGEFWGSPVYLGELQTDDAGRLLFLGGRGVSASYTGAKATTFANNDTWHDDVSDGPVTATVSVNGVSVPVTPAWVVTAPPNYGPDIISVRTMYDLVYDAMVTSGVIEFPLVDFDEHIAPILRRLCGLQWVNAGFAAGFGWGARDHFLDADVWARLADPHQRNQEYRRQVLNTFRLEDRDGVSPVPWPWLYGDAMNIPAVSPRQMVSLSPTQMRFLDKWAAGDFIPPADPKASVEAAAAGAGLAVTGPTSVEELPLNDQPASLDRAALDYCLADAFHPGCEMTWPMRHASMFMAPFRIRHRRPDAPEPDYGPQLTPDEAVEADGPLYAQGPGDISRWMAVPWQTDTASCRSGYEAMSDPRFDPYLPTFWPARVPNHVLSEADYDVVMDTSLPIDQRLDAFAERRVWWRFLTGSYVDQINTMVSDFGKMGVVESRPGPGDNPAFPPVIGVESQVGFDNADDAPARRNLLLWHVEEAGVPDADAAEAAVTSYVSAAAVPDEEVTAGFIDKVRRFRR